MKSKSIHRFVIAVSMPLGLLLGGATMAATADTTTQAKEPSEELAGSGKDNKDAFEQASGMKRDQPTGPDPTPGEMKQQQPHNSNIEQEVKEAKTEEMKGKTSETPQNKEDVEKALQEEGIPPATKMPK